MVHVNVISNLDGKDFALGYSELAARKNDPNILAAQTIDPTFSVDQANDPSALSARMNHPNVLKNLRKLK